MSNAGRKPKPTRLKDLDGDPKSRYLSKNEPKPPRSKTVKEWPVVKQNPAAHKAFRDNVKILRAMQMLTDAETALLNIMALCQARIEEAEAQVEAEGVTIEHTNTKGESNKVSHPSVGVSLKYAQLLKNLCTEFGMTPSSRGRLELPTDKKQSDFEGLLD